MQDAKDSKYSKLSVASKKSIKKNSARWNEQRKAQGLQKRMNLIGRADEIDLINAAVAKVGKSKIKSLVEICQQFLENK